MSMMVLSLSDCPPKLRGDLSKWLIELNTGVYVGKVSARVREELWDRVCENLAHGKATMVYSAKNEQGMEFKVFQTSWEPVDFDGITLMRRPLPRSDSGGEQNFSGSSKAAQIQKTRRIQKAKQRKEAEQGYVVIDLETTGLSPQRNEILEIGAVKIVDHEIEERFSVLVKVQEKIPENISALTGITADMIEEKGKPLQDALTELIRFMGDRRVVFYNAGFDRNFLQRALEQCGMGRMENSYEDSMVLAKRNLDDVGSYKLETVAKYLGIESGQEHRAMSDSELTWKVYEKLKEIELGF